MSNAFEELLAFQRALKDLVASVDATYSKQYEEFYIGLEGSFGSKHVTPRTLTSRLLGSMVCVEGIITKCEFYFPSLWAPLLTTGLFDCFALGEYMFVISRFSFFFRFSGAS